jgi:hypothetical protein
MFQALPQFFHTFPPAEGNDFHAQWRRHQGGKAPQALGGVSVAATRAHPTETSPSRDRCPLHVPWRRPQVKNALADGMGVPTREGNP